MYTLIAIFLLNGKAVTSTLTKHKDQPSCLKAMEKVIGFETNNLSYTLKVKATCVEE